MDTPNSANRPGGAITAAALMMLLAGQAYASVTPGEQFVYDWTETAGPQVGLSGTADFTLGSASTTRGFFNIASLGVTQNGGFCGICTPLTTDLSSVLFDAAMLGVVGKVTGTFHDGGLHAFDLLTMDLPAGTWTFQDTGPTGVTVTSTGTYQTRTVPEPAILGLFVLGLLGIGWCRRRFER
jgi:hypothetical protein